MRKPVAPGVGQDSLNKVRRDFNGEFLYVLDEGTGAVSGFRIESDGSLTAIAGAGGLPLSAQGIAAE
jgi:hypothetical protein